MLQSPTPLLRALRCKGLQLAMKLTGALLVLVCSSVVQADEVVAHFGEIQGVVSVQRVITSRFVLAVRGAPLSEGDLIVSEKNSIAQVVFTDGSQVALRPNSRLSITQYHYDKAAPREDHLLLDLVRGGLRTITGLVGKRGDQKAYELRVGNTATIGIRGTDYIARLCEADCAEEQAALSQAKLPVSEMPVIVARVEGLVEHAEAVSPGRAPRSLFLTAPLYNGDEIRVSDHGHLNVLFSDNTRTVFGYGTRAVITNYHFDRARPAEGGFLLNLLRGGLRSVTGLIGKANPAHVGYKTPTATIGIRGTAFDLRCVPLGTGQSASYESPPTDCDQTLIVTMRQGSTFLSTGANSLIVSDTQSAVIDGPNGVPTLLPATPPATGDDPSVLPEQLDLNVDQIFGVAQQHPPSGVYAAVFDGSISLTENGKEVVLGPGEAGFAPIDASGDLPTDFGPSLLNDVPTFIRGDTFLQNFDFDPMACIVS